MKKTKNIKQKTESPEVAIEVRNLRKSFKIPHEKNTSLKSAFINIFNRKRGYTELSAINDISFSVNRGEFFGIIGKNGSGKSTLLKILAGIYSTDSGSVKITGKLSPFLELGVGFNPELTGRENIFLGGALLGLTRREVAARYDDIVKFAELEDFIDMKLKNYSSGMQVRLAFALSIHVNAEVLLMDEVLAVGDSNFQQKCLAEFERYRKEGKTVVLVTHDLGAIRDHCDRALLLKNGKIVKLGKSVDVVESYVFEGATTSSLSEKVGTVLSGGKNKEDRPEITQVVFLDKNKKTRNVFQHGEDFSLRVYFTKSTVQNINFAFGIYSSSGQYVFGANTIGDRADVVKAQKRGYFEVQFKSPVLNAGSYYSKISIADKGFAQGSIYSYVSRSQDITIITNTYHEGLLKMPYKWD